jgi:hypothetical protein
VVLLDPRPESHLAVQRYRQHGIAVCVLTSRRLEPAFFTRGVTRALLPSPTQQPQRWEARLLELAAVLEPRPLLIPCSGVAASLLLGLDARLAPHYALVHLRSLLEHEPQHGPTAEAALRRTILRGEPAMEIQVVLDAPGNATALCALTWTAGAHPDAIVSSVAAPELVQRSLAWLRSSGYMGYARLIWAPDRNGHMELHAASPFPGLGWSLALEDGVDFPMAWYAALVGKEIPPSSGARRLSRRVAMNEPGNLDDALPLATYAPSLSLRDPLPWVAGLLASLVRR